MAVAPTTENGPLHTSEATLDDRAMVASFATPEAADAARRALVDAGIADDRIHVANSAAEQPGAAAVTQPADDSIIGRIREAILPEDSETATRAALRHGDAILTLRPEPQEVETAIRILQAAGPSRFDADLERWRNTH